MNKEFQVHILTTTGIEKAKELANIFDDLLRRLTFDYCPNNREFSIVKTKLEEACFFAKKSMAINNQIPVDLAEVEKAHNGDAPTDFEDSKPS